MAELQRRPKMTRHKMLQLVLTRRQRAHEEGKPPDDPCASGGMGAASFQLLRVAVDAGLSAATLEQVIAMGPKDQSGLGLRSWAQIDAAVYERLSRSGGLAMEPVRLTAASGKTYVAYAVPVENLMRYCFEEITLANDYEFTPTYDASQPIDAQHFTGITSGAWYSWLCDQLPAGTVPFVIDLFSDASCEQNANVKWHSMMTILSHLPLQKRFLDDNIYMSDIVPLIPSSVVKTDAQLRRLSPQDKKKWLRLERGSLLRAMYRWKLGQFERLRNGVAMRDPVSLRLAMVAPVPGCLQLDTPEHREVSGVLQCGFCNLGRCGIHGLSDLTLTVTQRSKESCRLCYDRLRTAEQTASTAPPGAKAEANAVVAAAKANLQAEGLREEPSVLFGTSYTDFLNVSVSPLHVLKKTLAAVQQAHLLSLYAVCDSDRHFHEMMDDVNNFYITQAALYTTIHGRVAKQGVSGTLTGDKTRGPPVCVHGSAVHTVQPCAQVTRL